VFTTGIPPTRISCFNATPVASTVETAYFLEKSKSFGFFVVLINHVSLLQKMEMLEHLRFRLLKLMLQVNLPLLQHLGRHVHEKRFQLGPLMSQQYTPESGNENGAYNCFE